MSSPGVPSFLLTSWSCPSDLSASVSAEPSWSPEKEDLSSNAPTTTMTPPARGRLRVSTVHQRVFHPDPLSPTKPRFRPPLRTLWPAAVLPDSPAMWLVLYFLLNLSLTLYNKSVLIHFPFPYTLTALHAFCGTIGTFILLQMETWSTPVPARMRASPPLLHPSGVPTLNGKELVVLFLFSILYTLNIVVSNASLRLVTVPFHQVVRASAPFFTILFSAVLLHKRSTKEKLLSLIPVVAGVGFATYGDYYFTALGFLLTLLGTLLAAMKTILTNVILIKPAPTASLPTAHLSPQHQHKHLPTDDSKTYLSPYVTSASAAAATPHPPSSPTTSAFPPSFFSSLFTITMNHLFPPTPNSSPTYALKPLAPVYPLTTSDSSSTLFSLPKLTLSPLHLLYLLSPLAFIQTTLLAHFTGELDKVRWHLFAGVDHAPGMGHDRTWLLLNGIMAFFLNVVSFNANRRVGPLGMSVAANVKQVLTVLCAVVIFDLTITPMNGLGIGLTLVGGACYAVAELREKKEVKRRIG